MLTIFNCAHEVVNLALLIAMIQLKPLGGGYLQRIGRGGTEEAVAGRCRDGAAEQAEQEKE